MAIYTHKKAISEYKKRREYESPNKPELNLPEKPVQPKLASFAPDQKYVKMADIKNDNTKAKLGAFMALGIFAVLLGGMGVVAVLDQLLFGGQVFNNDEAIGLMVLLALIFPIGIIFVCKALSIWKKATQDTLNNDEYLRNDYERKLKFYQLEEEEIKSKYNNALKIYKNAIVEFNDETNTQLKEFDSLLNTLENCLEKLYAQNIIYSKYRNLISVATIYEYFESGRCCELEGANGAYNMYENELRANIIIGSLSQIISDIQQIKNGQYALYQQLNYSNQLLKSINNNTQLTAYFANVAAVAASADRYIVGMVW